MSLDRFARRFLDLTGAGARARTSEPTIAEMRQGLAGLAALAGPTEGLGVEARDEILPGTAIPLRVYSPSSPSQEFLPGLVYFHGGGWVSGDLESHDPICRALAGGGQCRIIAVDYRLAPEHRFPAAIDDCLKAVEIITEHASLFGLDSACIGVAGDSAGANLAVVVCRMARGQGVRLALQVLLCPVMDALGRTQSRQTLGVGYFLDERTMVRYWEHYRIDGLDPDDPRVSPLRARDFHNMPPALVHTAEYDLLCDEGALYAIELARAGVKVRHCQHPGMIHHFYGLGGAIPYAATALAAIGAEIREAFGSAGREVNS
jgi:acetyl esterase